MPIDMTRRCRNCKFPLVLLLAALFSSGLLVKRADSFSSATRRAGVASKRKKSCLESKWRRSYFDRDDDDEGDKEREVDRPTKTKTERYGPSTSPAKPKIVVLGATGRIGRLVISQLMEMSMDCTIVALVQNYKEASHLFYGQADVSLVPRNKEKGPKLEIVEGDLVPPESMPNNVGTDQEEIDWEQRANSTASFYGTQVNTFDNREDNPMPTSIYETLEYCVRDCTAVISCVGAVRPTNAWTDLLKVPLWRLLRKDVSKWCTDKRHPFYVHYAATRQVLGIAESEQRRRQALAQVRAEQEEQESRNDPKKRPRRPPRVPRIRFVRISDLCVAQQAWAFVPLITNTLQSMVFRYQHMAERIMDDSSFVDTVTIRPGDLMDEDRDLDTTSLQVDSSGRLPSPARVGRADVAALAVSAALFTSNEDAVAEAKQRKQSNMGESGNNEKDSPEAVAEKPFHFTLAVRWAGQELQPYPPQGYKHDGLEDAQLCMNRVLRIEKQKAKRQRRLEQLREQASLPAKMLHGLKRQKASIKPYGASVALVSYLLLGLFITTISKTILQSIPGGHHVSEALTRVRDVAWASLLKQLPFKTPIAPPRTSTAAKKTESIRFRNRRVPKSHISF